MSANRCAQGRGAWYGAEFLRPGIWHDRGRSLLTREQIVSQTAQARRLFEAAMRGLPAAAPSISTNHR